MSQLANAFALLELDVPDNKEPSTAKVADNHGKTKRGGKGKNKTGNTARTITSEKENKTGNSADTITSEKENKTGNSANATTSETEIRPQNSLEVPQSQYKMPLVWIDLEMTGLDVEVDKILEIACIITDGNLTKLIEGPHLVIFQSKECLDGMGEWCQTHHAASGLTEKVLKSKVSEKEAEKRVIEFVEKHVGSYTPSLAGNSVYTDFIFLKKYMPDLASLFSHVLVDVSSVKALCVRWYPKENKKAPSKENKHRALEDIKESIAELKYYKENIFKPSQSKK